jgi:hypothetical protein
MGRTPVQYHYRSRKEIINVTPVEKKRTKRNNSKAPFGRAPTSFSFSDAFTIHALFTGALFLSPPLTEPVGAGEASFFSFTCSHGLYERRDERQKELL